MNTILKTLTTLHNVTTAKLNASLLLLFFVTSCRHINYGCPSSLDLFKQTRKRLILMFAELKVASAWVVTGETSLQTMTMRVSPKCQETFIEVLNFLDRVANVHL